MNKNKTFHIQTFGCQMNERDSETLAGLLAEKGYVETEVKGTPMCLSSTLQRARKCG